VAAKELVEGVYISALAVTVKEDSFTTPPATRTCPVVNNVAVGPSLALLILPTAANVPVDGV
jgi:hypothetical protein